MFKITRYSTRCLAPLKNKSFIFLNFSEKNKSFLDKLRDKFNLSKEDTKINTKNLTNRDEDKDNLNMTKLQDEELPDELKQILTKQEKSKIEEEIEKDSGVIFSTDIELEKRPDEIIKKVTKGSVLDVLKLRYDINVNEIQIEKREEYNKLNFNADLLPRLEKLEKLGFNDFLFKVIFHKMHKFLLKSENVDLLGEFKEQLKSLLNLSNEEACDIVACIPNIIELSAKKVEQNIANIKEFLNLTPEALKQLLIDYPILITNFTSDLNKILFYFNLYLKMNKEDFYNLATKFTLILTTTPDNALDIFRVVDRMKWDRNEWRMIIERNPRVFLFRHTQITNVVKILTNQGLTKSDIFEFIKQYPDLLLANRYDLLRKKMNLLGDLKLNSNTIQNLVKTYPFILLKSYNSFINKVFYFHNQLRMNIENIDIYPLIYVYNLERDIKPRCELMKKYNTWLPFSEAFSMSIEDLAKKLNAKEDDSILIKRNEGGPMYERDLLFRYSKYHTI